jgi:hypothetical protein
VGKVQWREQMTDQVAARVFPVKSGDPSGEVALQAD